MRVTVRVFRPCSTGWGKFRASKKGFLCPAEISVTACDMPDTAAKSPDPQDDSPSFDEALYLRAYPDVALAVERGELPSGQDHFRLAGKAEGRLFRSEYREQVLLAGGSGQGFKSGPTTSIDRLVVSASGAIFLVGWADDARRTLTEITLYADNHRRVWRAFSRLRRADVEAAVGAPTPYHYGFWVFGEPVKAGTQWRAEGGKPSRVEFGFADGSVIRLDQTITVMSDIDMRDLVMGYFANASYHGNGVIGAFAALDTGVGRVLAAYNQVVSAQITRQALVQRFGQEQTRFKASLIVPIYGMHHYHYLQSAAFAGGAGIEDCEFIYVLNSPELVEPLTREMRIAAMVYGHAQSLVVLPGNAGFGAANNVAAQFARSDRLICVNPDVFPKDPAWAKHHADLLDGLPTEQTRLFGATLYYDDGSLMHGGMYIDLDLGIVGANGGLTHDRVLRVEHHGKGAPEWALAYQASRPVTGVTGAFISVDRNWFESLGGFSETYIYGHYEDADLCLKSLRQGTPSWVHPIAMWHLEGKGSTRLPHHAGGSLVNRWLFTRTWESFVTPDLIGRTPAGLARYAEPLPVSAAKAAAAKSTGRRAR